MGQQIIAAYSGEPWFPLLAEDGFAVDTAAWAQLTAWADYDPSDDLACLKTPALAIFGEDDPLVPVHASMERYAETAARTGRVQQAVVFPGADHRLRVSGHLAPGYLDQLTSWCKAPGALAHPA